MSEREISAKAKLGKNFTAGYFVVIEDDVEIGENVSVGHNVVIHAGTKIGNNVRIGDGTVIGRLPMKASRSATTSGAPVPPCEIGDNVTIGSNSVIYAGSKIGNDVLIADLATIRENVTIGEFTIVGRGVAIENKCKIGSYVKLETNVYITAYSEIGDYVFVAPGVLTSNDNFVGRTAERFKHFKGVTVELGGRIGVGAVILPGKKVGADALVAAGALLTKDAPPRKIVAGLPAKEFRDVPEEQLLENQGWF
jgi:UDP-2-acetamido-3-amino-2,3-dideoxy-glucuronate N-acetyltransferase